MCLVAVFLVISAQASFPSRYSTITALSKDQSSINRSPVTARPQSTLNAGAVSQAIPYRNIPTVQILAAAGSRVSSPLRHNSQTSRWGGSSFSPPQTVLPILPDFYVKPGGIASKDVVNALIAENNFSKPESVSIDTSFQGINANCCSVAPPDVQVAAGPSDVVEMVNLEVEVWNKQGTARGTSSMSSFFLTGSDSISDPKVLYDYKTSRWFGSILDITTESVHLGVSQTADPAGSWWIYDVTGVPKGNFPDQPILGVSSDIIALGANDYNSASLTFLGGQFWIINKTDVVAGAATYWEWWGPSPSWYSVHPVHSLSDTGTQYLVSTSYGGTNFVTLFSAMGTPPGPVSVTSQMILISTLSLPPNAQQPGTSDLLDTGDARVQDALQIQGKIWLSSNDACQPSGDTSVRSCVRLILIDTATDSTMQDFDFGAIGYYYFYPALSADSKGDLTVIFGYSSLSVYPSAALAGQAYNDPAGSIEQPLAIISGTAANTYVCNSSRICRYGDYFGAGPDPSGSNTWFAVEYITSGAGWSTFVGSAQVKGPATFANLILARPGADAGQTVSFTAVLGDGPCNLGKGYYCSFYLPFGDGASNSISCEGTTFAESFGHVYSSSGFYSPGSGGYIQIFYSSSCTLASLIETVAFNADSITISPFLVIAVGSSPASGKIDLNQQVTFTGTVYGGSGGYTYYWTETPSGCNDTGSSVMTCTPTSAGAFSVALQVTDSNLNTLASIVQYSVDQDPLVSLNVDHQSLDVGQPATLNAMASLGAGNYSYNWSGLPSNCLISNGNVVQCNPNLQGTYTITVSAADSNQYTVKSNEITLSVYPDPTVNVTVSPASILLGQKVTFAAIASGGLGTYSYSWSGLPPGCLASNSTSISCTPSNTGTFSVLLTLQDSLGWRTAKAVSVTIEQGFIGLPATEGYTFAVVLGALIMGAIIIVLRVARRRGRLVMPPNNGREGLDRW